MPEQRTSPGRVVLRLGGALALLGGAFLILRPFLVPTIWAAIIAYVTWPLYRRARDLSGWPRAIAAAFTLAALLLVGFPVAWILVALAEQATALIGVTEAWIQAGAPTPTWIAELPGIDRGVEELRAGFALDSEQLRSTLGTVAGRVSDRIVSIASGAAGNVFAFAVTLLALYVFYVDGERMTRYARPLAAAVFPSAPEAFLDDVGSVVRAVVFGLLGTAIVQAILQAIGLALFGVPSPVALGALTAVLSFVPAGPVFVWGGAALWLFFEDRVYAAVGMVLWGVLLVSSVDNFLRPLLIGRSGSMRIPFILIFFGVLGGLVAFGMLGLFVGPVILSVAFALIADFALQSSEAKPAGDEPAPS